ncbi:MAG: YkgJ family cysteine cluster protein [Acidobacteria bacterium]|nr:YkgJ family cysteine cluster protein [Acidobacteriota bacterium]
MVTGLDEVRRLAEAKRAENLDFRRYLCAHHYPIEPFQLLAAEIQKRFDCTQCANCCRYTAVDVSPAEIAAIACHLGESAGDIVHRHTAPDPADSTARILLNRHDACTFLHRNLCLIYDARPAACRGFPHLSRGDHSLGARLESLCRHAWFCPIVYNALESYKRLVGYHPGRRFRYNPALGL